ncbi:NAD(P)H-binding protein [Streptomyces sp. NPDC046939]|uniref:NAD(P)H-binding protein n=1 Tax=Streptomyces sp. NPDC046939 TaxID=3155376 RepID=UPI0033D69DF1
MATASFIEEPHSQLWQDPSTQAFSVPVERRTNDIVATIAGGRIDERKNSLMSSVPVAEGVAVIAATTVGRTQGRAARGREPWPGGDGRATKGLSMIVVSAASGGLGRRVVDHLLARRPASQVAVAARTPERVADLAARGVQVRHGDYDAPDTLRSAFEGADRLLLISSPELDPARRIKQHQAAIDAARATGVGAVAYTSFLEADTRSDGVTSAHHATEQALKASGLPHTVLRHPFYSEGFLRPALHSALASGELRDATDGRGLNTASRADLAEAAAHVLTEEDHVGGAYDFTGPLWSYPDLVQALARVCGRPVAHRLGHERAEGVQGWLEEQIRSGVLERQTDDLRQVLRRAPATLDETLTELLADTSG